MKSLATLSIVMGIVSVLAILVAHLALTDIRHGEADLAAEWLILQIAASAVLLFHVVAFVTLFRLRTLLHRRS